MKKAILILSLSLFSFTSANCLHTVFEVVRSELPMYDKTFNGLIVDSAYWDKGTANNRGKSIYIMKYYWNDGNLDSLYEANLREGEWQYRTTKSPMGDLHVSREGNIWTIEGAKVDGTVGTEIIYFDGDSLASTSKSEDDTFTSIYVLKKDTLFHYSSDRIIVLDETDTNKCYEKEYYNGEWTTWDRYETEIKDGMTLLTRTNIEEGLDHKTVTYFMFRRNGNSTTSIHRKIRPAYIPEKAKHFDLLGRPVQGKYTVEFLK